MGMKNVAATYHLVNRSGVWTYRRRVPTHLVEKVGKREVKKSLGTKDKAEAKRLATVEDLRFDAWTASLEAGVAATEGKASTPWTVTTDDLIDHARAYVADENARRAKRLIADPPETDEERRNLIDTVAGEQEELTAPERSPLVNEVAATIAARAGVGDQRPAALLGIAARALGELARMQSDRLVGDYTATHHDVLFAPQAADAKPKTSVAALCGQFITEVREDHRLNGISTQRTEQVATSLDYLKEAIGPATRVAEIDDDVVQKLRSTIARTPANRNKVYPGLTLEQQIERGEKEGRSSLAHLTQRGHLETFRNLMKFAVRKKLLPSNPAEDVKPLLKETVPLDEKRFPFRLDQIKAFFEGSFYHSCAPGAPTPYTKPDREWRYWLPLIMLFTGARPNEVCQLFVEDIRRTEMGTWYFDLIDESETQSRKNGASRRRVPIHPELVRLGFLDFVVERRKKIAKNGPRLFHELKAKPERPTNFAWYPGKRFNEVFLEQEITVDPRQAFYSIRHSVRDAHRRIKTGDEALLALGGWTPPAGKAVSSNYGDINNPDLWVDEVAGIAFGDLDLSFLYPKGKA